ncbi:MAG: hypothetical protein ACRESZ_11560 [Methylococcales bacterium]
MVTREPKCIQWKRRGAEQIARQTSDLSFEQELIFWQDQTKRLKILQAEARHRQEVCAGAEPEA